VGFKPEGADAFWMTDAPIDPADPLAPVKLRARDLVAAAEVLDLVAQTVDLDVKADAIDQAADLFGTPGFDPVETYDACEAAGMTVGQTDSAANVAVTLREIELHRE
jgi:hypothetical protein